MNEWLDEEKAKSHDKRVKIIYQGEGKEKQIFSKHPEVQRRNPRPDSEAR